MRKNTKKESKESVVTMGFTGYLIMNQDNQPLYFGKNELYQIFRTEEAAFSHLKKNWMFSVVNLILGKKRKIVEATIIYKKEII